MKKLKLLGLALLALIGLNTAALARSAVLVNITPATTKYVQTVVAGGGSVTSDRILLINTTVGGLQADGVWSSLIRLWLLANQNATAALTDIVVANTSATAVSSPTFATDLGYTTGTTAHLSTGYTPASPWVTGSASMGFAMRTNQTAANGKIQMGSSVASVDGTAELFVKNVNSKITYGLNDGSGKDNSPTNTIGIWVLSRTSTASTTCIIYFAGSSLGNNADSATSSLVPTFPIVIGGEASAPSGAFASPSSDQFSMGFVGVGLTAAQAAAFTLRIQTYLTAVGA